jgi:hypothetical protein
VLGPFDLDDAGADMHPQNEVRRSSGVIQTPRLKSALRGEVR